MFYWLSIPRKQNGFSGYPAVVTQTYNGETSYGKHLALYMESFSSQTEIENIILESAHF